MVFRIVWSRTSQRDLRDLIRFISKDSPERAQAFAFRLVTRVDMLQRHPRLGREVPEFGSPDIREVLFSPYRIVYRLNADTQLVEIIRVWHAARNIPDIGRS